MGKPSMYSRDYHRVMRKRKILFRTTIVIAAFAVIFLTYSKSIIPSIMKVVDNLRNQPNSSISEIDKNNSVENNHVDSNKPGTSDAIKETGQNEQKKTDDIMTGEYVFKFENGDFFSITYEKNSDDMKFTGIKPTDSGIQFDIRDDGKAIVFDYHKTNEIWIYYIDGTFKRLDSDFFTKIGQDEEVFSKADIMEEYGDSYIWAASPKFLKDGRIVYQSFLPWFKEDNSYYIWVIKSDGGDGSILLRTEEKQPIKYGGFTGDGKLLVTLSGTKYALNVEDGSIQAAE